MNIEMRTPLSVLTSYNMIDCFHDVRKLQRISLATAVLKMQITHRFIEMLQASVMLRLCGEENTGGGQMYGNALSLMFQ